MGENSGQSNRATPSVQGPSAQGEGIERVVRSADLDEARVRVEHDGGLRPFMRGILVHSLMDRGLAFDAAYEAASEIYERIRDLGVVKREALARMVTELCGPLPQPEVDDSIPELRPVPVIEVEEEEGREAFPFSKGTLSQSLLAAALDPLDAFDAAREIEGQLLRRPVHRVTRDDLRQLAADTLTKRFGLRAAERYLTWRHFNRSDKPVFVLLGGTTGVGKTSLGLEVAQRLGIGRELSTDSIRHVMRLMLSPDLMPALHVSSFEAHTRLPHAEPLEGDAREDVIGGYLEQAKTVSVGVRAVLDRAVEENSSLVLDGVGLVPGLIDLERYADRAHIFYLLVAHLDADGLRAHLKARAALEGRRGRPTRYVDKLDHILQIQDFLLDCTEAAKLPIVENLDKEKATQRVLRHVIGRLRDRLPSGTLVGG